MNGEFELDLDFEFTIDEETKKELEVQVGNAVKMIRATKGDKRKSMLRDFQISISNPHWQYVEYGTGPSKSGYLPASVVRVLQDWVRTKLRVSMEDSREAARSVAIKIAKEGIPPQPFVRPVIQKYTEKLKSDNALNLIQDIGSTALLAEVIKKEMIEIYENNNTEYFGKIPAGDRYFSPQTDISITVSKDKARVGGEPGEGVQVQTTNTFSSKPAVTNFNPIISGPRSKTSTKSNNSNRRKGTRRKR